MTQTALEDAEAALGRNGLRPEPEGGPGLPARLVLRDEAGRHVDLHPLLFDEQGNGWQELGDDTGASIPTDGLAGLGTIGVAVRCTTPSFSSATISAGGLTDTDRADLARLGEGSASPPARLSREEGGRPLRPGSMTAISELLFLHPASVVSGARGRSASAASEAD